MWSKKGLNVGIISEELYNEITKENCLSPSFISDLPCVLGKSKIFKVINVDGDQVNTITCWCKQKGGFVTGENCFIFDGKNDE